MSSFSSFDIINVVVPDPKIFICNSKAAVNPDGIKTLLANEVKYFFH